ncbi:Signal recognition particle 54 kDa protein 2 [Hordeum vulgare]|nr:Signal recognition particle 54 kDa protein 2 [Hordeum vulgare]
MEEEAPGSNMAEAEAEFASLNWRRWRSSRPSWILSGMRPRATVVDERVLDDCLDEITRALLQADVQFDMVHDMQATSSTPSTSGGSPSAPTSAVSSRCYMESDPVKIVVEGVERFRKENCDLIIVDTSGRHKQEATLFEEMRQVSEATKPDLVIFVMDGSIGQAAFAQAQAFRQSVPVGAVIVTKMDGHALHLTFLFLFSVAATKSSVIFIGTGEHKDELEDFDVRPFVGRLLGMGDLLGLMKKARQVVPADQQPDLMKRLMEGNFTLRLMYEQFQNLGKIGSIG